MRAKKVNENIDFKRGQNPKKSLGIGTIQKITAEFPDLDNIEVVDEKKYLGYTIYIIKNFRPDNPYGAPYHAVSLDTKRVYATIGFHGAKAAFQSLMRVIFDNPEADL